MIEYICSHIPCKERNKVLRVELLTIFCFMAASEIAVPPIVVHNMHHGRRKWMKLAMLVDRKWIANRCMLLR